MPPRESLAEAAEMANQGIARRHDNLGREPSAVLLQPSAWNHHAIASSSPPSNNTRMERRRPGEISTGHATMTGDILVLSCLIRAVVCPPPRDLGGEIFSLLPLPTSANSPSETRQAVGQQGLLSGHNSRASAQQANLVLVVGAPSFWVGVSARWYQVPDWRSSATS
jgi:hypothetical protein